MRVGTRSLRLVFAVALLFVSRAATAQYTPQVLIAPSPLPSFTPTEAFAINSKGQVFGDARSGLVRTPVLWTNGVPQQLNFPAGYVWNFGGQLTEFLNDNGTAVAMVTGLADRIVRWRNGSADPDIVPPTPPSRMNCSSASFYPLGLNNLGHVAILGTGGDCPWILWIWDGNGSTADHFNELTPVAGDATGCHAFVMRFETNRLNDLDHVAIMFGGPNPNCPTPEPLTAGFLAANQTYTPLITLMNAGDCVFCNVTPGIGGINNHDQLLATIGDNNNPDLKFWNGSSVVDLNLERYLSMNDLGHVFFASWVPGNHFIALYKNGALTPVPMPTDIPGYVLTSDMPTPKGINSTGQLALSMNFTENASIIDHVVVLTPDPPTVTLKVNGQHPNPPVVTTAGPMNLTLDVSSTPYTATVSWYWALVVNGQAVWVTSTGLKTAPAPLLVAPPAAIANGMLLNTALPPATTVVSLFFMLDASNTFLAGDVIAATRP